MSSVVFWVLAVAILLAGVFGIASLSVAIFGSGADSLVFSWLAGMLWGLVFYALGSIAYDEFVN